MSDRGEGSPRQIEVPAEVRTHASLPAIDYEDAFLLSLARVDELAALEWAVEVLERAPDRLRESLLSGWATIGFDLRPVPAQGAVLGWQIRSADRDLAILAAASPLGLDGRLVFARRPGALLYATFVALRDDDARMVWKGIEPAHPPIVRELLADVARRPGRRGWSARPL